jgi:His/Glu/Gln/Arg/opine family amino acid ABC transporter permease subunit
MFGPHTLDYARQLGTGAVTTLELGGLTLIVGTLLGFGLGLTRFLWPRSAGRVVAAYVEVVRAIPLLVLLFLGYYGIPLLFGFQGLSAFQAAVIIISAYQAAYCSEIVRAGLEAVPPSQWEAGRALGLRERDIVARIIAPQALRVILPPLTLQSIGTFKDTSVASIIGVVDLTNTGLILRENTGSTWAIFAALAAVYFVLCMCISFVGLRIEHRLDRGFVTPAPRPSPDLQTTTAMW